MQAFKPYIQWMIVRGPIWLSNTDYIRNVVAFVTLIAVIVSFIVGFGNHDLTLVGGPTHGTSPGNG